MTQKQQNNGEIRTQQEAFQEALILAITAPTDAQADRAVALANDLARGLTKHEIAKAKREAVRATTQPVKGGGE